MSERVLPPAPEALPRPATSLPRAPSRSRRRWMWALGALAAIAVLSLAGAWFREALRTESTDDAFVNGHVTFVAPRVPGQVARVLVDDNNRVRRGDPLVELDPEPYRVQLAIAESAVATAAAEVASGEAQARASLGEMRSERFALERSIEGVHDQVALLKSKVAEIGAAQATLARTKSDYDRVLPLAKTGAVTTDDLEHRLQSELLAEASLEQAMQAVYQLRVSLGLPPKPASGDDLTQVPDDLDQTFSAVRQAQAGLMRAAAQLGVSVPFDTSPRQMIAEFYRRDPAGDLNHIYADLLERAPGVVQARAKLEQARRAADGARLNLQYCTVYAEIDGVVTRRSVNPGNNVVAGQSLMAVRSVREIWVDANFKETQLGHLRIGQPVDLDVDMYGGSRRFAGRISGLTMGTGSTLALLPAENATGNFVKVVQRVPVRVELIDYDPEASPLLVGLSVEVTVRFTESPTGEHAGAVLQAYVVPATQPTAEATP